MDAEASTTETTTTNSTGPINLTQVFMVIAIIINVFIAITGVIGAVDSAPIMSGFSAAPVLGFPNGYWALFFFSLGLICFAVIGVICELSAVITINIYIQALGMFSRYWTRAIWYVLVGFLALGVAGVMGVTSAICCWILATFLLILELLVHTKVM